MAVFVGRARMMGKFAVLFWSFAISGLLSFGTLSAMKSIMNWDGSSFDRFGTTWIVLRSFCFGLFVSSIFLARQLVTKKSGFSIPLLFICGLFIWAHLHVRK